MTINILNSSTRKRSRAYIQAIQRIARLFLFDSTSVARTLRICISLTVGMMAFAIIMIEGLIRGMHLATERQLTLLYGDCMIQTPPDRALDVSTLEHWLTRTYPTAGAQVVQRHYGYALLGHQKHTSTLCTLYGIDSPHDPLALATHLLEFDSTAVPADTIPVAIGSCLAQSWGLSRGDRVTLWYIMKPQVSTFISRTQNMPDVSEHQAIIVDIVSTGLDEIDQQGIIVPAKHLTSSDPVTLVYTTRPLDTAARAYLAQAVGPHATVQVWQDLLPALAAGCTLERWATHAILALIWAIILITFTALTLLLLARKRRSLVALRMHHVGHTQVAGGVLLAIGSISAASVVIASVLAYTLAYAVTTGKLLALPHCYYQAYVCIVPSALIGCMLLGSLLILVSVLVHMYTRTLYATPLATLMDEDGLL